MTIDVIDNPQKVQTMRLKKPPMQALRIEWGLIAASSLLFLGGGFLVLSVAWQPGLAARWLVLPSLVIAYLLHVLWRNLELNHREGELDLLPDLGWGNRLTLLRGLLVAGMMGFLLCHARKVAGLDPGDPLHAV
jgi:CDP-diacylglycerol--glycerol-3-phosphate 3-phosphatidyltransferase